MVNTPYPLPRQTRESDVLVGNGSAGPYGPSQYKIFDIEDVTIWTRPAGALSFADVSAGCTITKTSNAQYDTFSVTFWEPIPETTEWYHSAKRVAERSLAVTRAGSLDAPQLEQELSKQASAQSELRRDVDAIPRFRMGPDFDPIIEARPNEFLGLNIDGTKIIGKGTPGELGAGDLLASNNLSDVTAPAFARTTLATSTTPQGGNVSFAPPLSSPAVLRTVQSRLEDVAVYPHDLKEGVGIGNEANDTDAMHAVLALWNGQNDKGGVVGLRNAETLLIGETLQIPRNIWLRGQHLNGSCLQSNVIGAPLFDMADVSVVRFIMSDLRLQGNGLTGASGNGHAICMIDPDVATGSHLPQNAWFERVMIDGFRGADKRKYDNSADMEASALFQFGGLGCGSRDLQITNCGRGIVRWYTQNCLDIAPIISLCDKVGVQSAYNERYVLFGADVVSCADTGGAEIEGVSAPSGNIVSYWDEDFAAPFLKTKNSGGKANVVVQFSEGSAFDHFWLQCSQTVIADGSAQTPHKGFYVERSPGTKIRNGFFHIPGQVDGNTVEVIELYNSQSLEPMGDVEVTGNRFSYASGMNTATRKIAYMIKATGASGTRLMPNLKIENNYTARVAPASACLIDDFIVLQNISMKGASIKGNTVYAPTGVTITNGIRAASVSLSDGDQIDIANSFNTASGTITNNYSGITEGNLYGSVAWDPGNIVDGSSENKAIIVTGAVLGDFVEAVSFGLDTGGMLLTGEVSASNTVRARLQNETAVAGDLGSSTVYAHVKKRWAK